MAVEFFPAFEAIPIEAMRAHALGWSIELRGADFEVLGVLRVVDIGEDPLACELQTEEAVLDQRGHPMIARVVDEAGALQMTGVCGPEGSSGRSVDFWVDSEAARRGAPVSVFTRFAVPTT